MNTIFNRKTESRTALVTVPSIDVSAGIVANPIPIGSGKRNGSNRLILCQIHLRYLLHRHHCYWLQLLQLCHRRRCLRRHYGNNSHTYLPGKQIRINNNNHTRCLQVPSSREDERRKARKKGTNIYVNCNRYKEVIVRYIQIIWWFQGVVKYTRDNRFT